MVLDENLLAEGHEYLAVGNLAVSPDHRWLAYSTDTDGSERYTMRFRDLVTGAEAPEELADTTYGVAWANDNATVFYVRVDQAMRPYQLWRHRVGTDPGGDVLVYEEPDEHFYLGLARTKDDRFIVCGLESKMTTEVHVLSADEPEADLRVIEPRRHGIEYSVDHDRGDPDAGRPARFLIVTNDGAEDFRLMEAPEDSPGRESWREVIPGRPTVRLDAVDPFARHLAVFEREEGETRLRILDPVTGASTTVDQPESPSTVWGGANPEYDAPMLRYEYTSLVTPRSVFDRDFETGEVTLRKQQPVLGDFDTGRYRTERLWATGADGTRVPLSIVYRPDLVHQPRPGDDEGGAPCLLYGYGSYEMSIDPAFSSLRLSLLDRGFVYAIAHVRGGGEMGRALVRGGPAGLEAQHLHRLHRLRPHTRRGRLDRTRAPGGPGRQRRRPAHGRGGQPRSRAVPGHGGRGALRRLPDHHPGRDPAPHRARVGGVGQPGHRPVDLQGDEVVLALRQRPGGRRRRAAAALPRPAGDVAG